MNKKILPYKVKQALQPQFDSGELTQTKLGEKVGLPQPSVSGALNGRNQSALNKIGEWLIELGLATKESLTEIYTEPGATPDNKVEYLRYHLESTIDNLKNVLDCIS